MKCAECGFVFAPGDFHINYDGDYLEREEVITKGDLYAQFRAHERVSRIARFVPPNPGKAFLDIGIGDGLLLQCAEKLGYSTFGLDINQEGLRLARDTYGIRAALSLEPIDVAFAGLSFDVIHMNEVIEHVGDPISLLDSCRKRLNDGGVLVIQTGNIDSVVSRLKGREWNYIRPVHVSYFSTKTLLRAVERCGFRPVKWMTVDWRLESVLRLAIRLLKEGHMNKALVMVALYVTSPIHGIRRNIVLYAM